MPRHHYRIFSEARIASLTLPNRLVRSAVWDPCILKNRKMTEEVLGIYQALADGGVGMIVSGGLPVTPEDFTGSPGKKAVSYDDIRIEGIAGMPEVVHAAGTGCKIVAQLENGNMDRSPSAVPSPFKMSAAPALTPGEIERIVAYFVEAVYRMREEGFDGVQLHAAHGGVLSLFLSPYSNRRKDAFGGSTENRVRIVREIVGRARERVSDFPILIKMNGTDYVEGGIDIHNFPALAEEIERSGIDAVEVSGGLWDCLVHPEDELGFRPVPAPESHTRITKPSMQSYFCEYAESADLTVPTILVGGNRDIERLEEIVTRGKVDFIALARPLIREPDLPNRWREGRGSSIADCVSCNSCLYDMLVHPGKVAPGPVRCVFEHESRKVKEAQQWLSSWVHTHAVS